MARQPNTTALSLVLFPIALALAGCGSLPDRSAENPICEELAGLDLALIRDYDKPGETPGTWDWGDFTHDSRRLRDNREIPLEGKPECVGIRAAVMEASGYNWWGGGMGDGFPSYGTEPADGRAYEGLAYVARRGPASDSTIKVEFGDYNTKGTVLDPEKCLKTCYTEYKDENGNGLKDTGDKGDDYDCDGVTFDTNIPRNKLCLKKFWAFLDFPADWGVILLPWSAFRQDPEGAVFDSIDPRLYDVHYFLTTASTLELWIDAIYFYRRPGYVPPDAGADAGN
jgi:hypothetical protein